MRWFKPQNMTSLKIKLTNISVVPFGVNSSPFSPSPAIKQFFSRSTKKISIFENYALFRQYGRLTGMDENKISLFHKAQDLYVYKS